MNTTRGPLRDVRVRRALNLGDRRRDHPAHRRWPAAASAPPARFRPASWATIPPARRTPGTPPGARRLLAEAGYAKGFALQLWRSKRAELARMAQSVQQDLASVGIRVEIVERDAPSVRAAVRNGGADLFLGDWYADYPDPENFSYPALPLAQQGPGRQLRLPRRHRAGLDDRCARGARPTRWRRRGCRGRSTRGSSSWRPGSSSGFRSTSGPCSPR